MKAKVKEALGLKSEGAICEVEYSTFSMLTVSMSIQFPSDHNFPLFSHTNHIFASVNFEEKALIYIYPAG